MADSINATNLPEKPQPKKLEFGKVFQNRPFIAAVAFTLAMLVLHEALFVFPHAFYVIGSLGKAVGESVPNLILLFASLLLTGLFFWQAFSSTSRLRPFYLLAFTVPVLVEFGYWNAFQRFMTPRDFHTALNSTSFWLDAVSIFFDYRAFIPIAAFLLMLGWTRQTQRLGTRAFLALLAAIIAFNSLLYFTSYQSIPSLLPQYSYKTLTTIAWTSANRPTIHARDTLTYQSEARPQKNIVFVIDETVRGDHLSINGYERETTPYLEALAAEGLMTNWGTAVSSSTCSIASNATLIMGLSTLPDPERRIEQNPSLFHYAKAMGYTTYHFDAQQNHLWNGLTLSDLDFIDHWITAREFSEDYTADIQIAERVADILQDSTGNFIVINKRGVHFPYDEALPEDAIMWRPVPTSRAYTNHEKLSNIYDSALRYNLETFFHTLLPDTAVLANTDILYTSDHGESLSQNGERWAHCSDAKTEAIIPLFILSQRPPAADTAYRASHFNIFPTLLDLMEVPPTARLYDYPLSLLEATAADSTDRYFLSGKAELFEVDSESLINFDEP